MLNIGANLLDQSRRDRTLFSRLRILVAIGYIGVIPFVSSSKFFMSCLLMAPSFGAKARKDVARAAEE